MSPINKASQPIVIFGGFLSFEMIYRDMRDALIAVTGQPVSIVRTLGLDWLPSVSRLGWMHLLRILDRTVRRAAQRSSTGKVTLIGHSAGGVLARLYLSPRPFLGHAYGGLDRVDQLITLGSPHHNRGGLTHGGRMSRWIDQHYPGAAFAPQVKYTSVAGQWLRGNRAGTSRERLAFEVYRDVGGDGNAWGDGLIPIESALLRGAQHITLEGVSHHSVFGDRWYGRGEVIPLWWNISQERHEHDASQQPIDFPAP